MGERLDDQTRLDVLARLARDGVPDGCRLRIGGQVGRNLYLEGPGLPEGGVDVGCMATTSLAETVVEAFDNAAKHERVRRRLAGLLEPSRFLEEITHSAHCSQAHAGCLAAEVRELLEIDNDGGGERG